MIYTVLKIDEDLDYGCEERAEDQPVTALVTLRSPGGEESTCRMPDQLLYDNDINEEDKVIFDEDGLLTYAGNFVDGLHSGNGSLYELGRAVAGAEHIAGMAGTIEVTRA